MIGNVLGQQGVTKYGESPEKIRCNIKKSLVRRQKDRGTRYVHVSKLVELTHGKHGK